jgi:hypothetical protein
MQMAMRAQDEGLRVMFQSFEMTAREMKLRYDAMRAHIAYSRLLDGALHLKKLKTLLLAYRLNVQIFGCPTT